MTALADPSTARRSRIEGLDARVVDLESERIWSRRWVSAGVADQIDRPGQLLPCTMGHHGAHVLRRDDGTLDAAYNSLQQGSCWTIPAQCGNGYKIDCPYAACGHSRDPDALTPDEDGAPTRIMRQFLGISVHRRIPVELHELGPLLLVSMPCEELPDPDDQFFECSRAVRDGAFDGRGYLTRTWWELRSGWRTATDLIFAAFGVDGVRSAVANDEKLGEVRLYRDAPNLALAVTDRLTVVFVIKPAGLDRVDVLAAVYGRPADADEVSAALIDVENRIAALPRVDRPSPISDWAARILRADG